MLIDAAVDGQGIALARTALAAWDLINGRLVRPIDVSLRMSNTYWIVCPKATSAFPRSNVPRMAAGGGGRRCAPPENSQFLNGPDATVARW